MLICIKSTKKKQIEEFIDSICRFEIRVDLHKNRFRSRQNNRTEVIEHTIIRYMSCIAQTSAINQSSYRAKECQSSLCLHAFHLFANIHLSQDGRE